MLLFQNFDRGGGVYYYLKCIILIYWQQVSFLSWNKVKKQNKENPQINIMTGNILF